MNLMFSSSVIQKYFFKQLLLSTLLNTLVLTLILLYGNLQKHGEVLIQSIGFSIWSLFELVFHLIPYSLSMGLPFGFALAVLFCVGRWSSDREILALRSHGFSISQWSVPIFLVGFLLSILSLYAGVEWAPVNRAKFDELKKEIIWTNLNSILEKSGQITFPLNSNNADSSFEDLTSLATEKPTKISISVSATHDEKWENARFVLTDLNGRITSVLHAGETHVSRSPDLSQLILNLKQVDLEPGFIDGNQSETDSSPVFLSFQAWKKPILIDLFQDKSEKVKTFKKMGFQEKIDFLFRTESVDEKVEIKFLLHKGIALGLSPLFLSFFLLPISAKQGKRETMINLLIGLTVCLAYFGLGSVTGNLLEESHFGYLAWWAPNIICLFIGFKMLSNFELKQ